jgi:hypothetical protein
MTERAAAERYLLLGLRIDRHVEGMVDAYFGPPALKAAVDAEPAADPHTLVAAAEDLLDELEDGWLRDQVVGLRTFAGVLAGESLSYPDEVEGSYGVRPVHTDEAAFAAAHERLEDLLPGHGPLGERYQRWRKSIMVPPEQVGSLVAAVVGEARAATRRMVELPQGEGVDVEIVHDQPWLAFNYYLGHLRSRVSVNVDLPISALDLLELAIHETYPGHHAERCCKEQLLVRERGLLEETIVVVPAPQSLVSEGIAELAPMLLLEGEHGAAFARVLQKAGIELDLRHALEVERAREPCRWADVNAALLFHDAAAGEEETRAYVERWGLLSPEIAAHLIRFLKEPTSRTYLITYAAGRNLCRSFVGGDPERFRRLLTEQVRVRDLLAAAAG